MLQVRMLIVIVGLGLMVGTFVESQWPVITDCGPNKLYHKGRCVPRKHCNQTCHSCNMWTGECVSIIGQPCRSHEQCDEGQRCASMSHNEPGTCEEGKRCNKLIDECENTRPQCDIDYPCPRGQRCNSSQKCVKDIKVDLTCRRLSSQPQCHSGTKCIALHCVPCRRSTTAGQCSSSESCIGLRCFPHRAASRLFNRYMNRYMKKELLGLNKY